NLLNLTEEELANRKPFEDIFQQITSGTLYFQYISTLIHNPLSELPYFGINLFTLNLTFNSSLPISKPTAKPLELYENPWEDLINEKNPATYLTGVMTAEIEKDSITPNMSENLTNNEIIKANKTLMNNWDIFVKNISKKGQTMKLEQTNIVYHQIDTRRTKPIKQRAYQVAPDEQTFLESEIRAMEQRRKDVNMMDIEEEDLSTEQEAFKAAMPKHTIIPKKTIKSQLPLIAKYNLESYQNFQCTSDRFTFDNIPKYNWSYVKFLSTKFGAREKRKNKYIHNWYMNLEEKAAEFNDWYHDTDDWPIEETIPASKGWPELVTESETNMWNLSNPYTWETSMNEPELLPATVL
ncbi:39428_t:CDS:2, partial [Gigaspora margarita]